MRIVWISKNFQVTTKKYTYRTICTLPINISTLLLAMIVQTGLIQIANRPYFPVFSRKIAPLFALWKSMRIIRISKNFQVTSKKYTYRTICTLHMHAHAQHMNFESSHTVPEIQWYAKTLQNM